MNLDHIIRERAYALWEQAGRVDGLADHHWLQAERELSAPRAGSVASTAGRKKRAGGASKRKSA